tara:strand:- start:263 stop:523 length:261 start_codon:yes stop_codon:yes gene_type:complete
MSHIPDDLKMLTKMYKDMNIEELKANIAHWEENIEYYDHLTMLQIAKKELENKQIERQEQIELLTKALTSSSRLGRLFTSIRAILN